MDQFFCSNGRGGMMTPWMMPYGWGLGGFLGLILWFLIVLALVAFIRWLWQKGNKD